MSNDRLVDESNTKYCGDGVYVIFDGSGIWLHANDLRDPSDRIYLEPKVLRSINLFFERVRK